MATPAPLFLCLCNDTVLWFLMSHGPSHRSCCVQNRGFGSCFVHSSTSNTIVLLASPTSFLMSGPRCIWIVKRAGSNSVHCYKDWVCFRIVNKTSLWTHCFPCPSLLSILSLESLSTTFTAPLPLLPTSSAHINVTRLLALSSSNALDLKIWVPHLEAILYELKIDFLEAEVGRLQQTVECGSKCVHVRRSESDDCEDARSDNGSVSITLTGRECEGHECGREQSGYLLEQGSMTGLKEETLCDCSTSPWIQ